MYKVVISKYDSVTINHDDCDNFHKTNSTTLKSTVISLLMTGFLLLSASATSKVFHSLEAIL